MKVSCSPLTQRVCLAALLSGCSASHLGLQVEDEQTFDGGSLEGGDAGTDLDGEVAPPRDAEAGQDSAVDSQGDASIDMDAGADASDAEVPPPVVIEDPDLEETSLCVEEVPSFVAMFSDGQGLWLAASGENNLGVWHRHSGSWSKIASGSSLALKQLYRTVDGKLFLSSQSGPCGIMEVRDQKLFCSAASGSTILHGSGSHTVGATNEQLMYWNGTFWEDLPAMLQGSSSGAKTALHADGSKLWVAAGTQLFSGPITGGKFASIPLNGMTPEPGIPIRLISAIARQGNRTWIVRANKLQVADEQNQWATLSADTCESGMKGLDRVQNRVVAWGPRNVATLQGTSATNVVELACDAEAAIVGAVPMGQTELVFAVLQHEPKASCGGLKVLQYKNGNVQPF